MMTFPEYLHLRMAAFGNAFLAGDRFPGPSYFTEKSSIVFFDGEKLIGRSVTDWWNSLAEQRAERLGFVCEGVVVQLPDSQVYWTKYPHDSRLRTLLHQAYAEDHPFLDGAKLNYFARNTPVYAPFHNSGIVMPRCNSTDLRRVAAEFGSILDKIHKALEGKGNEWELLFLQFRDFLISGSKEMETKWINRFEGEDVEPKNIEIHQSLPNLGYSIEAHRLLQSAIKAADNTFEHFGYNEGWQHQEWSIPFREMFRSIIEEAIAAAPNSFMAA